MRRFEFWHAYILLESLSSYNLWSIWVSEGNISSEPVFKKKDDIGRGGTKGLIFFFFLLGNKNGELFLSPTSIHRKTDNKDYLIFVFYKQIPLVLLCYYSK